MSSHHASTYKRRKSVLADFFNPDHRYVFDFENRVPGQLQYEYLLRAFKTAVLLCGDHVYVPPTFILECPIALQIVKAIPKERLYDMIRMPLRDRNISDLFDKKLQSYKDVKDDYGFLYNKDTHPALAFVEANADLLVSRESQVSKAIAEKWLLLPDEPEFETTWLASIGKQAQRRLIRTPTTLLAQGRAITRGNLSKENTGLVHGARQMTAMLQSTYADIYITEYSLATISDLPNLSASGFRSGGLRYSFVGLREALQSGLVFSAIYGLSLSELCQLRYSHGYLQFFDKYDAIAQSCEYTAQLRAHYALAAKEIPVEIRSALGLGLERLPVKEKLEILERALLCLSAVDSRFAGAARNVEPFKLFSEETLKDKERRKSIIVFIALSEEEEIFRQFFTKEKLSELPYDLAIVSPKLIGRVPAAIRTMEAINEHIRAKGVKPDLIVVIGIAGGFEERKVKQGDVIVATSVFDLASIKLKIKDGVRTIFNRPDPFRVAFHAKDYVESPEKFDQTQWAAHAVKYARWPKGKIPQIHVGPISCGDQVVANDEWPQTALGVHDKMLGIEMEAGGVCYAADKQGCDVVVLRGVSDLANSEKQDDSWRGIAMHTITHLFGQLDWHDLLRVRA